jgi:competence ComEA-like helix-hairpin-helix protein
VPRGRAIELLRVPEGGGANERSSLHQFLRIEIEVLVWIPANRSRQTNQTKTKNERRNKIMRKSLPILLTAIVIASIGLTSFAAEQSAPSGVVNINTADVAQLSLLPRVGARAAQRIVDYRKEHGNFQKATDLMQVKGFGDKTFERLSSYITVEGKTTLTSKIRSPRKPRSSKAS